MSTTLTPQQRHSIHRARALIAASKRGPAALAAEIEVRGSPVRGDDPYPEAFGLAHVTIEELLAIIDGLTGDAS